MAKTNKQLQAEIDELIIERNNLIDKIDTLEGNIDFIKSKLEKNIDDKENYHKQLHYILLLLGYEFEKDAPKFIGDKEYKFIETQINLLIEFKDKHDEQFKTIINYEKELEKQDKEIEELKKELDDWRTAPKKGTITIDFKNKQAKTDYIKYLEEVNEQLRYEKRDLEKEVMHSRTIHKDNAKERGKQLKEVREQLSKKQNTIVLSNQENQYLFDCLQKELQSQIILKNTYKKENKRLKKRRREGRYNPKKVYEKLARGRLCYIPEGDYLPTKVHESLIDAMEEGHRLADKTGNQVYIVGTYCKI